MNIEINFRGVFQSLWNVICKVAAWFWVVFLPALYRNIKAIVIDLKLLIAGAILCMFAQGYLERFYYDSRRLHIVPAFILFVFAGVCLWRWINNQSRWEPKTTVSPKWITLPLAIVLSVLFISVSAIIVAAVFNANDLLSVVQRFWWWYHYGG